MSISRLLSSVLFLTLLAICGCGGGRAGISGKVTLDGEPIENGLIRFIPIEGTNAPSGGSAITNGAYQVPVDKGLMAGKYRVEITGRGTTGKKIQSGVGGPVIDEVYELVPKRYNKESELTLEMQSDSRVVDYDLKTK